MSLTVTISGDICITHRNLSVLPSASEPEVTPWCGCHLWMTPFFCLRIKTTRRRDRIPIVPHYRPVCEMKGIAERVSLLVVQSIALRCSVRWTLTRSLRDPLPREIFTSSQVTSKFILCTWHPFPSTGLSLRSSSIDECASPNPIIRKTMIPLWMEYRSLISTVL